LLPLCPGRGKGGSRINPSLALNEPCWPAVHLGSNHKNVGFTTTTLVTPERPAPTSVGDAPVVVTVVLATPPWQQRQQPRQPQPYTERPASRPALGRQLQCRGHPRRAAALLYALIRVVGLAVVARCARSRRNRSVGADGGGPSPPTSNLGDVVGHFSGGGHQGGAASAAATTRPPPRG
jgi:hypothetical protein